MNFSALKLLGIVLGLSALIVGGTYLYKQSLKSNDLKQNMLNGQTAQTQNKEAGNGKSSLPAPLQGSPSEDKIDKYVEDVAAASVASGTLDMTNCKPNPEIIKVKTGDTLTIQNNGDKDITVLLTANIKWLVPAKKSTPAKIDTGGGVYPLSCQEQGGSLKYRVGTFTVERNVSF